MIILHQYTKNHNTVPEIWHMTDNIFVFPFESFLPFHTPNIFQKNQKVYKNETSTWRYHHFAVCTKNYNHMMHGS